jgi:hypothetical protein
VALACHIEWSGPVVGVPEGELRLPLKVYVIARHSDSYERAIFEAANTPGDTDSIEALVGVLVAARHGLDGIPRTWSRNLARSVKFLALASDAPWVFQPS